MRLVIVALVLFASAAAAQEQSPLRLTPPERLVAGDRKGIWVELDVSPEVPVLVTPRSEGTAVQVVRGRLVREDAEDPTSETLRLRIPIVANEPGIGVVRVDVSTAQCEGEHCRPLELRAVATLRVESP